MSTFTHGMNRDCPKVQSGEWSRCLGHETERGEQSPLVPSDPTATASGMCIWLVVLTFKNGHRMTSHVSSQNAVGAVTSLLYGGGVSTTDVVKLEVMPL